MKIASIYTFLKTRALRLLAVLLLTTLSIVNTQGQQLLQNGDFENFSQCPNSVGQINRATNWYGSTATTSDYFNTTCGYTPINSFYTNSNISPHSGNGMIGLVAEIGGQSWKEYAVQQLGSPLIAGMKYSISFFMRKNPLGQGPGANIFADLPVAERGFFGVCFARIGDFTPDPLPGVFNFKAVPATTALNQRTYINASDPAYTSLSWTPVTLQYTAIGGETIFMLGQFRGAPTSSLTNDGVTGAFYYIDGVSLTQVCNAGAAQVSLTGSTLSNTCPSNTVNLNSLSTGTAPTNTSLVWFNNANHTGTAYATPATAGAGTYFAFFYDAANNCYNTDASTSSVTVSINGCSTCPTTAPTLSVPTDILCWNSTKDLNVFISSSTPGGSVVVWKDAGGATVTNPVNAPGVYTATYFNAALNCSSPAATFTLTVIPDPVPSSTTINICSPATTADVTNVVTAPVGSGYTVLWFNSNGSPNSNITALPPGTYNVWYRVGTLCYNRNQVNVTITNNPATCTTVAGTIDCNKTRLVPSPVAGTASQVDLVVTVNVTTAGCFTPIAVGGSGFSIASGITQVCATRLGVQEFHLPVNYNGAVLSSLNFTIGQAGSCVADLTKPPKKKEVTVWTLDNCTPPNIGPVLK